VRTIDIIDFSPAGEFPAYHHTTQDNMSVIDKRTLKAVGQTVLQTIYGE
jgi:glutaminyl-peptide cyclotransferase